MLPPLTSPEDIERTSSAFTLSDMEMYIFPELMFALVLANIISPNLWAWKEDPWFAGIGSLPWGRQVQRLKQYIMDHYSFNLDLETWGLTTKTRELARFRPFVEPEWLTRSNALFGYEGDRYYFDIDIRRHFGLDRYDDEVVPYWKTETIEAMDAFRFKPGYRHGAGECVSLAALYAAAFYVVLDIPLDDIFLMATPLHSQTFVTHEEGVLTNNRRILTHGMWTNGTELSIKARRALEHERVTVVAHHTGWIHIEYPEATLSAEAYNRFTRQLGRFVSAPLTFEVFINFLRVQERYRPYFQFEVEQDGHRRYLAAETLFRYEHGSKNRIGDRTRRRLLAEVETEEFDLQPLPGRQILNILETRLNGRPLHCRQPDIRDLLRSLLPGFPELDPMCDDLLGFVCVRPRLPVQDKAFRVQPSLPLRTGMRRDELIEILRANREEHRTVDLALYASRHIDARGWPAFLKACLERNPVTLERFRDDSPAAAAKKLQTWPDDSIYDGNRLATPDEVVNFGRGDGLEKSLCLLNLLHARTPEIEPVIEWYPDRIQIQHEGETYTFASRKVNPMLL